MQWHASCSEWRGREGYREPPVIPVVVGSYTRSVCAEHLFLLGNTLFSKSREEDCTVSQAVLTVSGIRTDGYRKKHWRKVCLVPHALNTVFKSRARETEVAIGPDCTRCSLYIDSCPTGALRLEIRDGPSSADFWLFLAVDRNDASSPLPRRDFGVWSPAMPVTNSYRSSRVTACRKVEMALSTLSRLMTLSWAMAAF